MITLIINVTETAYILKFFAISADRKTHIYMQGSVYTVT